MKLGTNVVRVAASLILHLCLASMVTALSKWTVMKTVAQSKMKSNSNNQAKSLSNPFGATAAGNAQHWATSHANPLANDIFWAVKYRANDPLWAVRGQQQTSNSGGISGTVSNAIGSNTNLNPVKAISNVNPVKAISNVNPARAISNVNPARAISGAISRVNPINTIPGAIPRVNTANIIPNTNVIPNVIPNVNSNANNPYWVVNPPQPWMVTTRPIVTRAPITRAPLITQAPGVLPGGAGATQQYIKQVCKKMLAACQANGQLATRLTAGPGGTAPLLTMIEDFLANFDSNGDGCVTRMEFEATVMKSRGFTRDFARFLLVMNLERGRGVDNMACPGAMSLRALRQQSMRQGTPLAQQVSNNNTRYMVTFCEELPNRYRTNCDCIQLPSACQSGQLATLPACQAFNINSRSRNECPFTGGNTGPSQYTWAEISRKCTNNDYGFADGAFIAALCRYVTQNCNGARSISTG